MPPCEKGDLFRFQLSERSMAYVIEHAEPYDAGEIGSKFVLLRWFGEQTATKLAEQFKSFEGAKTILYKNPPILEKIKGIAAHDLRVGLRRAATDWALCDKLYPRFEKLGVRPESLIALAKEAGPSWGTWLTKNPYFGMKYGIDVTICDRYARDDLSWPSHNKYRGFALVRSVINTLMQRGQTVVSINDVTKMCKALDKEHLFEFESVIATLASAKRNPEEHPAIQWWAESYQLLDGGAKGKMLQLLDVAKDEESIVSRIKWKKESIPHDIQLLQTKIKEIESINNYSFQREQIIALVSLTQTRIGLLMGRSGTGKTFILRAMIDLLKRVYQFNDETDPIILAVPHGNAVKRLAQFTDREVKTVSELINETEINEKSIILLDEAQLLDRAQLAQLLVKIPDGVQLIMAGDVEQLINGVQNYPFRDLCISAVIPIQVLRQMHPDAGLSIDWANQVLNRVTPQLSIAGPGTGTLQLIDLKNGQPAALPRIKDSYLQGFRQTGKDDVVIITPHSEGIFSPTRLNLLIQEGVNPQEAAKFEWKVANEILRVGDRIRQLATVTKSIVPTHSTGWIVSGNAQQITIEWNGYGSVVYGVEEIAQFSLAYAIPMNQLFGSQWACVILVMMPEQEWVVNRRALYTTMAKCRSRLVTCFSQESLGEAITQSPEQESSSWIIQRFKQ